MSIIAKYKFNQNTYANFIPEFNSEFTDYTVTDEMDTDGYTIRTIESNTLPTLIRFGTYDEGLTETEANSLLSVEYIDISNITKMSSMFYNCKSLTSLNVSNWDTSNVTNMYYMFNNCQSLTSLDLSSFNTSKVINMNSMFRDCSKLTSLDLSSFNTSLVTNMTYMFYNCKSLTSLDVSNFDFSKTNDLRYMFYSCTGLTSLDLSNWDTSQVTNTSSMFSGWKSSQKVYISSKWTLGTGFSPTFISTFAHTIAKYKFNQNTYANFIPTFNSEFTDYVCNDEIDTDGYTIRTIGNDSGDLPTLIRFGSSDTSGVGDYTKQSSLLEVNEINTSNVTDMSLMFYQCISVTYINTNFNTSLVANMSGMFNSCSSLTSLDVSGFNTSNVNTMGNMFTGCSRLTSLDVSSFDTSKVTNMNGMFYSCPKLTSLDLSNFDTSKVTVMDYMFYNCQSLTSIDLSSFNTSNVTNMANMFRSCSLLTSLDVSSFDTSEVNNMESMFRDCSLLTSLDVSNFNTSKVTTMTYMFTNCSLLTSLDVSNFNTSKVTIMMGMFNKCSSLTSLDVSSFDTNAVTNMSHMFISCSSLTSLNISNFNTEKVASMPAMFQNCTSLKVLDLTSFNTKSVTSSNDMFLNLTSDQIVYTNANLWTLDTSTYNATFVSLAGRLIASYKYNTNLYSDLIPTFTGLTSSQYTINDLDTNLTTEVDTSTWVLGSLNTETGEETASTSTYRSDYIEVLPSVEYFHSSWVDICYYDSNKAFISHQGQTSATATTPANARYVRLYKNSRPTTFTFTTQGIKTRAIASDVLPTVIRFGESDTSVSATDKTLSLLEVLSINTNNVTSMSTMFRQCGNLYYVATTFNTSKVNSFNNMFNSCTSLTSLNLSNFDTSNVDTMGGMFSTCSSLISLDISNFNTSKVTYMQYMFHTCPKLTSLDLSNFDTSLVTNMSYIFQNCTSLTSLDLSNFNTSKVTDMSNMFNSCSKLTSLDLSNFNTSLVTNMAGMFQDCSSLTSLDVSNFNTGKVTSMSYMFYNCSLLTSLNVSSFNTSNVTSMESMFRSCSSLTSLDLSNFNTSLVTDMQYMFHRCSSLTSLDVSNFNTGKVNNFSEMFRNCSSLISLDLSSFDIKQATNISWMFGSCVSLTLLDISNFNISDSLNIANMFMYCPKLKNIAMIYCGASSFNSLQSSFDNLVVTPVNVYYHDANLSELPTHEKVTYQYYDKSTVTLPYELNKLPNGVADYIDVVNGVYVQRVGKVVLDETLKDNLIFSSTTYFDNLYRWFYKPSATAIKADGSIRTTNVMCDKLRVVDYSDFAERNYEFTSISNDGIDIELMLNESHGSTREILASWLSSNPITVLYQLATPIYTPLTDEEKALLPLSSYENGYVRMSSDELRPSKFEFRAKSSNRMQLDMLETGHYYLNAPTGNVKLGDVDIDVTEMPCLINVSDASNKRLVVNSADFFYKDILLNYEEGYLDVLNGTVSIANTNGRWVSDFVVIPYHDKGVYIMNDAKLADVCYYDENKNFVSGMAIGNVDSGREIHLTGNTGAKYMRFSGKNSEMVLNLRSHVITLSKLPSHRIPTTFTQGMKSSVDFGYWEGIKNAKPNAMLMFDSSMVEKQRVRINNGAGIELNRISGSYYDSTVIVEDEIDISTGKYTKRIGKYVIDGSVPIYIAKNVSNDNYILLSSVVSVLKDAKRQFGDYGIVVTSNIMFRVGYDAREEHIFVGDALYIAMKTSRVGILTQEGIDEYFANNPMTVYYELETPEITYLDATDSMLTGNVFNTCANTSIFYTWRLENTLFPQVKSSPLSYPTTLSPNTQYTVFHNRKNYSGSVKTPMINLGGTEVAATGSRTVVTTPSILVHNELQFIGAENTVEQVMVLHGDWTKEGKTVDYFEGLQSSVIGDKTLENLVDEPINIRSSGVTGGAVDYVSLDDIVAGYRNKPKLPEVQVNTNIHSYGMTLQNLAVKYECIAEPNGFARTAIYRGVLPIGTYIFFYNVVEPNPTTQSGERSERFTPHYACQDGKTYYEGWETHNQTIGLKYWKFTVTSPITEFSFWIANIDASCSANNFMLLQYQEGMENWNLSFFEGMKSVENPIYHSVGKNLFNHDSLILNKYQNNETYGYSIVDSEQHAIYKLDVKANTTYSLNMRRSGVFYDINNQPIPPYFSEVDTLTTPNNCKYIIFNFTNYATNDYTGFQIEEGSIATPYEPYKENTLSTPQGTVLRGVGSYKDVMGWNDGVIRRNCVEFTITGEEGYSITDITENTNTILCGIAWKYLGLENKILASDNVNMAICDKLPSMKGNEDIPHIRQSGGQPYSGGVMFWFDKTKFSTYTQQGINDYIKSIGGLTIIAPLANTEYEDVEFTGGGNWNKATLNGSENWQEASEGDNANGFSVWLVINENAMVDYGNNNVSQYYLIESEELDWIKYSQVNSPRRTNFVVMNNSVMVVNVEGCHSVNEVKAWMAENPITVWYQTASNIINNTNPLIFNHGAVYTTTDTHPSTFLDFTLKTTNRYAVKDFNTLKYTVLTKQPFYLNGIDYPTSSTGMTIIDVANVVDTSIYSDDPMITVVQEDGSYYADGVLQQFKGEQTFVKEFIRTSNGTYNTGMTLLEPLELGMAYKEDGSYDIYNPIIGILIKNTKTITITSDEIKSANISITTTSNSFGGYSFTFTYTVGAENLSVNREIIYTNTLFGASNLAVGGYSVEKIHLYFHYDSSYGAITVDDFKNLVNEDLVFTYELKTPQIIQATPTSTYISTRPENGNIVAEETQIQAEYLNYDNEQSIISPRMLGDGDEIRWEQGSQCYVYENDNEYIPLTEHDELFGANIQAQEYTQYVESVEGAKVELGIALKEKAVYEQTYVPYEDTVIYPTTMKNIDETNGVEVDYICGATWQNPNDLSDIRHLGELREDGQYNVTIRRSGDDEIRLLEGTTNIGLDYDELPPSEFELTFFNNGNVEVGKYGDTAHVLEDCVENSKLASGTVYGQTLVNCIKIINYATTTWPVINLKNVLVQPNKKYIAILKHLPVDCQWAITNIKVDSTYVQYNKAMYSIFTSPSTTTVELRLHINKNTQTDLTLEELQKVQPMIIEYQDGMENWDIPYFEGIGSTVVNGFSSCGKNLFYGITTGTMEDNGLTWTWDNGIITLNGQKTGDDSYLYLHSDRLNIHPMVDGYYSISYKVLSGEVDTTECRSGNTYGLLTLSDYTNTHVLSLYGSESSFYSDNKFFYDVLPNKIEGCWIRVHKGAKLNNLKIQFQLERSSVHSAFEEPKVINYTLPTPITLRKVGDVCDTFDVVSGKLTQRIGEVVLDGSEEWIATTATDSQGFLSLQINMLSEIYWVSGMKMDSILKNDKVPITSFNQSSSIGMFFDGWGLYLRLPVSTRGDFIAYLKSNPITVQYRRLTESVKTINLIPSTTQTTQEPTFILPQPLRSVPNGICDRLYWDENKGHYCIEKRIGKLVLDNTIKSIGHGGHSNTDYIEIYMPFTTGALIENVGYCEDSSFTMNPYNGSSYKNSINYKAFAINMSKASLIVPRNEISEVIGEVYQNGNINQLKTYLSLKPVTLLIPLTTPQIIDLPHLNEKVELPTQPNIYPIGYKAVFDKMNPEIGLTIPYKVLNMPTQPTNLNFVMDIADYVLTWDDVKEARQYNVILNDNVIATVKEPQWNSGEEMYGYVLVEAQNEIGDSLSKELYIKTVPNAPAQLTVAHNPQTDFYDFEISFIDTSEIAEYFTVMYRVDNGEWVVEDIPAEDLELNTKVLIRFSIYEIKESIEVWATATNDVGTNDILPSAIYYMSPTPQWTYRINGKEAFLRWLDESPYDVQYKLRYSYKSNGAYQYAYFEGDASEIGKLYEAVLPLAEDDEVTVALCIISEKENLYSKPVTVSKALDPNIVPPLNFSYHWLARGLIEFYWEDQYNVDVEYEYILESMKSGEVLWETITEVIPSRDVTGTGEVYRVEHQLEDLEQIRMKVRMKWAMNETEWSETLTTVFIPVEGNPPTYIRRTQTAEGLLIEWEAQSYIDGYHIYVIDNKTGEELQHIETLDNSILVDIDYSKSIEIAIYEVSRFSGGIEADATDPMVFTPTMLTTDIEQRIYQPTMEEYLIETSTVQKGTKEAYIIHDSTYTPNVETEEVLGVGISTPFIISYHPMAVDIHQAGSRIENTINAHIKTLDTRTEELVNVMTFERTTATYDLDFRVYTPSTASYPINVDISKVRIVCLGDSLTSGHPFYWAETGTGDVTASYPYQLSRRLKNQYEVINSGYGSDTTDRCIARFDRDVLAYSPQYCIFQCGTNDLYWE